MGIGSHVWFLNKILDWFVLKKINLFCVMNVFIIACIIGELDYMIITL